MNDCKVLIELETNKKLNVTVYLDEILKQMKKNRHFAIKNYIIRIKE